MRTEKAMTMHGTKWNRSFDANKALAAIAYLVQETGADLYSVMKMLYLADKAHLGKYGRSVTGDEFTAMSKGPVPEGAYGLCKFVRGERSYFDAMPDARERVVLTGNVFSFPTPPTFDELSISDRRALDEVAGVFKAGGWEAVKDASHDGAWKAAWAEAEARGTGSIAIALSTIVATLPNGPALMEYLEDPHPGYAEECSIEAIDS
jgi:hypothetical protein